MLFSLSVSLYVSLSCSVCLSLSLSLSVPAHGPSFFYRGVVLPREGPAGCAEERPSVRGVAVIVSVRCRITLLEQLVIRVAEV